MTDDLPPSEYAVRCPKCSMRAVASMMPVGTSGTYREVLMKLGARRIVCDHCGCHRELSTGHEGEYELWYATEFKGHRPCRGRRGPGGAEWVGAPGGVRASERRNL